METCNHNLQHLRQESSHDGACYHVGSCLIDVFYCSKCGQTIRPQAESKISTSGTVPPYSS